DRLAARGRVRVLDPEGSKAAYLKCFLDLLGTRRPRRDAIEGADAAAEQILSLAEAPRTYVCCRENYAVPLAVACATPKQVAQCLAREDTSAVVRIDWDRVEDLVRFLEAGVHHRIAAFEVDIGAGSAEDCERRIGRVYQRLANAGFDRRALV